MKTNNRKIGFSSIAILLALSIGASIILIPSASAHTPAWQIPTYAYINVSPNPDGVGQTIQVYMWLDCVYGAAGGSSPAVAGNAATASAALLANNYRFSNYNLTIIPPSGTPQTTIFPVISDTTSNQETSFTPSSAGTYTLIFTYPGQVYGANGDGYSKSVLYGDSYLASSANATLTVQQTPIPQPTSSEPLPTNYWQEPIYAENSNWYAISSNWLGSGSPVPAGYTSSTLYHGDAIGPLTSHVMWTMAVQNGGTVGGNMFTNAQGTDYYEGSAYNPRFYNPIVINGYLYFTQTASFTGAPTMGGSSTGPTVCVNLRTGQQLWSKQNIPELSFGYIYNVWDPDQHGTFPPILVASIGGGLTGIPAMWELFDGFTGDSLFNVTNVPSGTAVAGPNGEQLRYAMTNDGTATNPQWYLSEWNSSKVWQWDVDAYTGGQGISPSVILSNFAMVTQLPIPITGETVTFPNGTSAFLPYNSALTVNANIQMNDNAFAPGTTTPVDQISNNLLTTYDWNISIPWHNTMTTTPSIVAADYGDLLLCRNGSLPTGFAATDAGTSSAPYTMFAINLNSSVGAIGQILWMHTYNAPPGNISLELLNVDFQTRVFVYQYYETMQWVGFSLTNGNPIWGPTASEVAFNYYDWSGYNPGVMAYGNLYSGGFGGVTYCWNDKTGALEWTWGNGAPGSSNSTYAGLNTPYGDYPTYIQSIANGVVYMACDEHTITNPIFKGSTLEALNATTGQEITGTVLSAYPSEWAYSGSAFVVADGYLTFFNGYDGQVYSLGRGSSQTTVTAPDAGLTYGQPVVIRGTVMDTSAGTQQTEQKADFPNGVPVCSDASMEAWMGYVYQQQPEPTNFTGVPVTVSVTDSNGNTRVIGTATTNEEGMYTLTWVPDISGNFTVTVNFAGTNGYWPSSSVTSFTVYSPSVTTAPTASPVSGLASESTLMYIGAAMIIVIVIVGAAILLVVSRKRP